MSRGEQPNYWVFGVGSTGNGIFSVVPGLLLMFYMTEILSVAPAVASLAIFAPKFVDVITDPLVGLWSDRTRTRLGARRPFLLVGTLLAGPLFFALFSVGLWAPNAGAATIAVVFSVLAVAYTLFMVPYLALAAEIPRDYEDRNRMNTFRMSYVMGGTLLSGTLAPVVVERAGGGVEGYAVMGAVFGVVLLLTLGTSLASVRTEPERQPGAEQGLQGFAATLRDNRAFRILILAYLANASAAGCASASLPYYAAHVLRADADTVALLFVSIFGTAILAMPMWRVLGKRFSKFACLRVALLLAVAAGLAFATLDPEVPIAFVIPIAIVLGFSNGAQQLFVFSMLADVIAYGSRPSEGEGDRAQPPAAAYSGVFLSAEKMGFAVGPVLLGLALSASGFVEGSSEAQSASAILGIRIGIGAIPAAMIAISLWVLGAYRRHDDDFRTRSHGESA